MRQVDAPNRGSISPLSADATDIRPPGVQGLNKRNMSFSHFGVSRGFLGGVLPVAFEVRNFRADAPAFERSGDRVASSRR